jgi:tetratricopeptide (TPR) repeat protein
VKLLERAAAQNYTPAWNRLGDFYAYGKCNVTQDGQKAIDCFLKAVELDENENDFAIVAKIYRYGLGGIPVDGQKAIDYFTRDYELNGNEESLDEIFHIYKYGCGELKADAKKAFDFLQVHPSLQIDCFVVDAERGYFRWDGLKTVDFLTQRLKKLQQQNAPDIIIKNELRGIAEIYSAGFGGLAPNRHKVMEYYKRIVALHSNIEEYKVKIAELTGTVVE